MDAVERDELDALRARAYGAAADIDEDPAALHRLQELESRLSAVSSPPLASEDGDVRSAPDKPASLGGTDSELSGVDSVVASGRAPRRRRLVVGVLWLLTLLAAAGVASAVTNMNAHMASAPSAGSERRVATLTSTRITELPKDWFGISSSSLVFEFQGLTLFTTDSGLGAGTNCFMVVPTSEVPDENADAASWSDVGVLLSGCKAGTFPAAAQAIVDERFPQELRSAFAPGSALKFVLDGDRIVVFSSSS